MSARSFPKISVITPSFNQAQFLEETINSVLSQNYPNLEYIIVDGKSTDGSHEIIKKYQSKLTWVKSIDKNQTDAINKGFSTATGDVLAYLNSDDLYLPNTFETVAKIFAERPELMWVTGDCIIVNQNGVEINKFVRSYKKVLSKSNSYIILAIANYISQPSTFINVNLYKVVGPLNESLEYNMDFEYWLRCFNIQKPKIIPITLSKFRVHSSSKGYNKIKMQLAEGTKVVEKMSFCTTAIYAKKLHDNAIMHLYKKFFRNKNM